MKAIYLTLIENDDTDILHYFNLFSRKIDCTIDEYRAAFRNINKISDVMKYKDFQYRLLSNTIHANDKLVHWKIVESSKCDFCQEKQDTVHLMFSCNRVQIIWKKFRELLDKCTTINVNEFMFTENTVILNTVHSKPGHIVNYLTLIIKQHIYFCKCTKKLPKFHDIVNKIERIYQAERFNVCVDTSTTKKFDRWKMYTKTL